MASIFNIGVSALSASQAGLVTTEHNIANANTQGYSRQQVTQSASLPQATGSGFFGSGVQVDTVNRVYNQFLGNQVLQTQTQSAYLDSFYAQVQQIDNMLADSSAGLSPALQAFFGGVQDLASNPSSVPSRQTILNTAGALTANFNSLNQRLGDIRQGVNTQLQSLVAEINSYATQIANSNDQIVLAQGSAANGQAPNDLLDQRDQLINSLNQIVKTTTVKQSDGSYNIFIGTGQALVVGQRAFNLVTVQSPEDTDNLVIGYNSTSLLDSASLTGGTLGGLLDFRSSILGAAQNSLGRVAIGLAQTFNDQHRLGQDLNGNLNADFFNVPVPKVTANSANSVTSALTASITDVGSLTTSDYRLSYNGAAYTLTRLSDNTTQTITLPLPKTVDGITFSAVTAAAGDTFLIQPTYNGAATISVAVTDTSKIAAAAPLRTSAALASNTGTGQISAGSVVPPAGNVKITFTSATAFNVVDNTTGATLAAGVTYPTANQVIQYPAGTGWPVNITGPVTGDTFIINKSVTSGAPASAAAKIAPAVDNNVTITFTSPVAFNVTDTTTGATLAAAVAYNSATGATLTYNGWTANLSGAPLAGDTFSVGPNTSGVSDNRNALLLSGLQSQNTLVKNTGGTPTVSYQGAYSQLVSLVGNKTREYEVRGKAQTALVTQTKQEQQSFSGVNLDEEAANLIRYQQAYQAAGKSLQTATTLFDTLLKITGG